jgi:sec-independent protein translocase protein TatB
MLDIGFPELLIIGIVALFVIGPKDLPQAFLTLGRYVKNIRAIGSEFQRTIDKAIKEADLSEAREKVNQVRQLGGARGLMRAAEKQLDPDGLLQDAERDIAGATRDMAGVGSQSPTPTTAPAASLTPPSAPAPPAAPVVTAAPDGTGTPVAAPAAAEPAAAAKTSETA